MEKRIRQRLIRYVRGRLPLPDLHMWLVELTWELNEEAQPKSLQLAHAAILAIAEYEHGDISVTNLHQRLLALAQTASFGTPPPIVTAASSITQEARWVPAQLVAAGRRSEAVPA